MNFIPLIICAVGGVIYVFTDHPKVTEIAKICFWTGLLVTLLQAANRALF